MHIHQPINVSSARLDEQWGNNHLICIACSHDSPFKDKTREGRARGWWGGERGEKLEKETTNRKQGRGAAGWHVEVRKWRGLLGHRLTVCLIDGWHEEGRQTRAPTDCLGLPPSLSHPSSQPCSHLPPPAVPSSPFPCIHAIMSSPLKAEISGFWALFFFFLLFNDPLSLTPKPE